MHRKTQLAWLLTPGGKVVERLLEPLYKPLLEQTHWVLACIIPTSNEIHPSCSLISCDSFIFCSGLVRIAMPCSLSFLFLLMARTNQDHLDHFLCCPWVAFRNTTAFQLSRMVQSPWQIYQIYSKYDWSLSSHLLFKCPLYQRHFHYSLFPFWAFTWPSVDNNDLQIITGLPE